MGEPKAVLVIPLPPEYKPSDPYPPFAEDDPGYVFESYDAYHEWLARREKRVLIHDPVANESILKVVDAAAFPRSSSQETLWAGPLAFGVVVVRMDGIGYARYANEGEPVPEYQVMLEVMSNDSGLYKTITQDERSVCIIFNGEPEESAYAYLLTPEPLAGEQLVKTVELPNLYRESPGMEKILYNTSLADGVLSLSAVNKGL